MKLSNIRRIAKEELSDAPDWIDNLLSPLNNFMEQSTQALTNNLTYSDNSLCNIQTQKFTHDTELLIANPFSGSIRPIGIHAVYCENPNVTIDSYKISYRDDNRLGVTIRFSGPSSRIFLTRNAVQSIPNAAITAASFNVSNILTGSGLSWSSATNPSRVTALIAGKYLFRYTIAYAANAVGIREGFLAKNGAFAATFTRFGQNMTPNNGGATDVSFSNSAIIDMLANDYVELYTFQNSLVALNLLGNAAVEVQLEAVNLEYTNISENVKIILIGG